MKIQKKEKIRILFICKERNKSYGPSFGLINSCRFIVNALKKHDIEAKVITVIDNNDIDRAVTHYRPTHVFIEALWVVPSKFPTLLALHPHVHWYVRIHSKIPFLAHEGMAIKWLREYAELVDQHKKFHISANNYDIVDSMKFAYGIKVLYFPNIYDPGTDPITVNPIIFKKKHPLPKVLDIGCFGAIRPMKNQLYQALAAITLGNELKIPVRFHINGNRIEKGDGVFHNLEAAFKDSPHELVKHDWMNHKEFMSIVKTMDLGMQVSFSETFDIVAADFVWNNIPLVGSDEIPWLDKDYQADPTCIFSIIKKLYTALEGGTFNLQRSNLKDLMKYNKEALEVWLDSL